MRRRFQERRIGVAHRLQDGREHDRRDVPGPEAVTRLAGMTSLGPCQVDLGQ